MSYLLHTNLLLRTAQPNHPSHAVAVQAIESLLLARNHLYIIPQNLIESWAVATRPIERNGLGMTLSHAEF